jgi:hypothetical protein
VDPPPRLETRDTSSIHRYILPLPTKMHLPKQEAVAKAFHVAHRLVVKDGILDMRVRVSPLSDTNQQDMRSNSAIL